MGILTARQHVCELLCFCVNNHSYRIKYFILRNNILFKVLKLASSREKCLVLAALRFFRTCIGLKDEFYNRYIIKNRWYALHVLHLIAHLRLGTAAASLGSLLLLMCVSPRSALILL